MLSLPQLLPLQQALLHKHQRTRTQTQPRHTHAHRHTTHAFRSSATQLWLGPQAAEQHASLSISTSRTSKTPQTELFRPIWSAGSLSLLWTRHGCGGHSFETCRPQSFCWKTWQLPDKDPRETLPGKHSLWTSLSKHLAQTMFWRGVRSWEKCPRKCRRNPWWEKGPNFERENVTAGLEKSSEIWTRRCDHREVTREVAETLPRNASNEISNKKTSSEGAPLHFSQSCRRDDSEKMFSDPGWLFKIISIWNGPPPFRFFVGVPEPFFLRWRMWPKDPHVSSSSDVRRNDSQNQKTMFSARCFYSSLRLQQQLPTLALTPHFWAATRLNTLHSPGSLTDIWPQKSQLKRFRLSSFAEPRRQSDPEKGRPCSLLFCLLTLMCVQAVIWWSERLFLLSLSLCLAFGLSLKLSVAHSHLSIQEHCIFCIIYVPKSNSSQLRRKQEHLE